MFIKKSDSGFVSPVAGIQLKPLACGDATQLMEFRLQEGAELPFHSHPNEQTGFLVSGRITLVIDGEDHPVEPGDSWCIPPDVEHGARIHVDSVAVEVFSPVRPDYLKENLE